MKSLPPTMPNMFRHSDFVIRHSERSDESFVIPRGSAANFAIGPVRPNAPPLLK